MRELVDSQVQSTVPPRTAITIGGRTLGTATSVGGAGATVCFSVFYPDPLKYTDPDGNTPKYATLLNAANFDFGRDYMALASANFNEGEYGWAAVMVGDAISEAAYDMLGVYAVASLVGAIGTVGIGGIANAGINKGKVVLENIHNTLGNIRDSISKFFSKGDKLTTEQLKSIRSYQERIVEHIEKLNNFIDNPTVRPGMESQPREVIAKQQMARINHLIQEIKTFAENINKTMNGE
jgi:hypothetical protein